MDNNPLAAEMAKLSLWLLTLAKDKPFEFLDHAIRCGDSLVGLHGLDQLRHFSLKPDADDAVLFRGRSTGPWTRRSTAAQARRDARQHGRGCRAQEELLRKRTRRCPAAVCGGPARGRRVLGREHEGQAGGVRHAAVVSGHYVESGTDRGVRGEGRKERRGQTMFHWPLEFPEVIVKRVGSMRSSGIRRSWVGDTFEASLGSRIWIT